MRVQLLYGGITLFIFLIEIVIALFVRDAFIRPFVGDLLVVVMIYFAVRTFFKVKPQGVMLGVLIFAIGVEFLQYFQLVERLGLEGNTVARVILGSTFDPLDILAYVLGVLFAYCIDFYLRKRKAIQ